MRRDRYGRKQRYLHVGPSDKAVKRERDRISVMTGRRQGCTPILQLIARLNRQLGGWANYFSWGYTRNAYRKINWHLGYRLAITVFNSVAHCPTLLAKKSKMTHLPNPDASNRARVIRMARVGMPEHSIAFAIGASTNTLRAFYVDAIRQAEDNLNLAILETLAFLANSGQHPAATIFWAKTRCGFMPAKGFKSDFGDEMPEFVVRGPNGEREEDYRR